MSIEGATDNEQPKDWKSATDDEYTDRRSLRLYSKKHRVYIFREFILDTYDAYLSPGDVVLDVAGGKGDLSWILFNVDDLQSVVMDPRRTINHIDKSVEFLRQHPVECRKRAVPGMSTYQPLAALMPQLDRKGYRMQTPSHLRVFVDHFLVEAIRAVKLSTHDCLPQWRSYWKDAIDKTVGFITPSGKNDFSIERVNESENSIADADAALDLILRAKLILGYHPDQATDACFELARVLRIPVCVVPCCTFPSEFPHRRLFDDENEERKVERYEDLIPYLLQENPSAKMKVLSFPGTMTARRIAIYTLPDDMGTDESTKEEADYENA